jgi:hypothetical protein
MRSEFRHRFQISSDIFIDTMAAKEYSDNYYWKVNEHFKGIMSKLGLNPFGFLMFSGIQVSKCKRLSNKWS